jgi:hypothetical protein
MKQKTFIKEWIFLKMNKKDELSEKLKTISGIVKLKR